MNIRKLIKTNRLLILLYLATVSAVIFGLRYSWSYDDPYITYRYAANLARGLGFVYNTGERILSTTAPLFAILLAVLRNFWQDLPHLANLIGAISLAVGGYLLWDLARLWKTPLAGWTCLLLYPFFPQVITTLGSETPFYLALIIGSFHAYAHKQYTWTALWSGLAILARPDAAVAPMILGLDFLIRGRKPFPWSAVVVFFTITISWTAFGLWYFGSPFPVTLFAKQQQGVMAISQRFFPGFLALLKNYMAWEYFLEAALMAIGIIFAILHRSSWLLFLAWSILYFVAYSILGVSRYFWYYSPLTPGFVLLVGLGIQAIWDRAKKVSFHVVIPLMWNNNKPVKNLLQIFPIGVIILLVSVQAWKFWKNRDFLDARMGIYHQVGEYLRTQTPSDATVGALEVGAIGYYSERPIVDFAGLIQPVVAQQMAKQITYEDTAEWAIAHFQPNYLVLTRNVFPNLERNFGASACTLKRTFIGKEYGYSGDLDIYSCRSVVQQ